MTGKSPTPAKSRKPTSTAISPEPTAATLHVVGGPHGADTRVLVRQGEQSIDITHCVHSLEVEFSVGAPNLGVLRVYDLYGEVDAEVAAIEHTIMPPPLPEAEVRLVIYEPLRRWWGGMRSRYRVVKVTPLNSWGQEAEYLSSGWMAPIGPLEIKTRA